jgi:hypothetical protein
MDKLFILLFWAIALLMAYFILKSCFSSPNTRTQRARPRTGGTGGGGGWFSGGRPNSGAPPPPYTAQDPYSGPKFTSSNAAGNNNQWQPGFWTGMGVGGLLGRLTAPSANDDAYRARQERMMRPSTWDWERPGGTGGGLFGGGGQQEPPRQRSWFGTPSDNTDRGEGSSNGVTRTSTGYGGSNVR